MPLFGPPDIAKLRAKGDIKRLIKSLEEAKLPNVRKGAAAALGEIGDARAVEPLIAALADPDFNVGRAAAMALGEIGDERAVEPLIAALGSLYLDETAAEALGHFGADAVEPLIVALNDRDRRVRPNAAWALGQIGDPRAVEPLIPALQDEATSWRAAKALGQISDPRAVEPLVASLKTKGTGRAAAEALGQIGAPAVEHLISALKDESKDVRADVAKALSQVGETRAVEPLVGALDDQDKDVREAVATALEALGWQADATETGAGFWVAKRDWSKCVEIGAPAVEPLIAALKDSDKDVRKAVAKTLGKIGDPRAIEPLLSALEGKNKEVRKAAASALEALGWQADVTETGAEYWVAKRDWGKCVEIGAPAIEPLVAALQSKDLFKGAAKALGQIGDPRAVEPLIAALEDERLRPAWQPATREIGDPRARGLQVAAPPASDVREAAADALRRIGAPAVDPLIAALRDNQRDVRELLVRALGHIGAPAVEPLLVALRDDQVSGDACAALGMVGQPAVESLIAALGDENHWVRRHATIALGQIGDRRAVEPLVTALKDDDSYVRGNAARALGQIGDRSALEPLVAALGNDCWLREAVGALDKLAWSPDRSAAGAAYWATKGEWGKCVEIGGPAVEPLIANLTIGGWAARKAVARALVTIWKSGKLGPAERQALLAQRGTITEAHQDYHTDRADVEECTDEGIGVDFPV
jgi:HEAT repeat protein